MKKDIMPIAIVIVILIGIILIMPKNLFSVGAGNTDQTQQALTSGAGISSPDSVGQTFTPTTTNINKIEVYLTSYISPYTFRLYNNQFKQNLLINLQSTSTNNGWQEIIFPSQLTVTPSQTYYFELTPTTDDEFGFANTDVYSGGNMYDSGTQKPYDLMFRTYYNSQVACTPNWQCNDWSICSSQIQVRNCNDLNSCGVNTGKPIESQTCTITTCTSSWVYGPWSGCVNHQRVRSYGDYNGCSPPNPLPIFNESCDLSCVADCNNKNCGNNGCGGDCGQCTNSQMCVSGMCQNINSNPNQTICTMEAKQCLDGTSVSRNAANNCEFDSCPVAQENILNLVNEEAFKLGSFSVIYLYLIIAVIIIIVLLILIKK